MPSPVALRASLRPSFIVLALVAMSAAGCSSDTSRFEGPFSNPFASSQADVTGSVNSPTPSRQIESKPLPAPGQTAAALPQPPRPAMAQNAPQDVTGSTAARSWDWNGGTAITVAAGDSFDTLSKRYGVPASAIMQANAITSPTALYPGQRLVIPRYHQSSAPAPAVARAPAPSGSATHTVAAGDTLIGISKRYNVAVRDLARANNIEPNTQVRLGQHLVIPGRAPKSTAVAAPKPVATPTPVAQAAPKPAAKPVKMASADPQQTARIANPKPEADQDVKSTAGGPAFRWPVRGRIIAGFGPKPNGQQNDGINLSVPEGTPIKAAEDGVVAYAGNELKGYGNLVLVRHSNGFVTAYAHASELLVKRGDTIKRGQTIAKAGQTGTVTSPQVHFEIRKGSSPVDPTQYLNGA